MAGVKTISLDSIIKRASNIYEAIIVAAKRARNLNEENKKEFKDLIDTFHPSSEDDFEDRDNTEQEKISIEFEKREKPHIQALEELIDKGIDYRYKEVEQ